MNWWILIFGLIAFILVIIAACASFYSATQLNTTNATVNNVVINSNSNVSNARNASWTSGAVSVVAAILLFVMLIFVSFTPEPKMMETVVLK